MVDSSIYSSSFGRTISNLRLPLNKIGSINKINKAYASIEQEEERAPSASEIASFLDMSEADVESQRNSGRHVSMDAPLVEGEIQIFTMFFVLVKAQIQIEHYLMHL